VLADSVGSALLVVLDLLAPAERVAFALHGVLAVPSHEIGTIVGRSPDAARQLASRARRRINQSSHGTRGASEHQHGGGVANSLTNDTLIDFGGGVAFNDTLVEVASSQPGVGGPSDRSG